MWLFLLRSPWTYAAAAMLALGSYAAVQHLGWKLEKANFAQFRAEIASAAAEAEVRNAQEAAREAHNAQEVLDGLQTRYAALSRSYGLLRANPASSGGVPSLSSAAASLGACPGNSEKPDSTTRRLAELEGRILSVLEAGDRELGKYRQLWELQEKNAAPM